MIELAVLQMIRDIVTIAGVVIGFTYYVIIIRSQNRTRQAQLFMQIYDHFREEKFMQDLSNILDLRWSDYNDFEEKYGRVNNPEAWRKLGSVAGYFEGIGVLVGQKLLDVNLVESLMKGHIIHFWEKIQPISIGMRKRYKVPEIDMWKEYLYNEIKKREK
jgi:hypothetical protein